MHFDIKHATASVCWVCYPKWRNRSARWPYPSVWALACSCNDAICLAPWSDLWWRWICVLKSSVVLHTWMAALLPFLEELVHVTLGKCIPHAHPLMPWLLASRQWYFGICCQGTLSGILPLGDKLKLGNLICSLGPWWWQNYFVAEMNSSMYALLARSARWQHKRSGADLSEHINLNIPGGCWSTASTTM